MIQSEIVHPGELTEHPANSNDHNQANIEELAESRRMFDQFKNIIVWQPSEEITVQVNGDEHTLKPGIRYVIAGNGFHQASILRGDDSIEIKDYSHLSYDEALLLMETDNASPLGSERNAAQMAANLERARGLVVDNERMTRMLERAKGLAGIVEDGNGGSEPPEPTQAEAEKYQEIWQCELGQMWQLGQHIVACLDSLDVDNIKRVLGDLTPTFVFSDPPYGISIVAANVSVGGDYAYDIPFGGVKSKGYVGGGARYKDQTGRYPIQDWGKKKAIATDGGDGRSKPFGSKKHRATVGGPGRDNTVEQGKYYPVAGDDSIKTAKSSATSLFELYPNACHVWWGGNYYTDVLTPSAGWIIWDKENTGNFADCEMAWTNQQRAARIFKHRWNGMLKASEQGQRRIHPTQKPIALAEWCFENYGSPGDIVIDPFLGSGITVLAAENLDDRRVIGFELEPVYIATVIQRWADHTGKTPQLIE